MSKRYPGNFITGNPVALSQTSNNGIWDLKDQYQAHTNGTWQEVDGIYEIPRSLRFRASASTYLSRTPASNGNRKTWTYSVWVKRSTLSSGGTVGLLSANGTTSPRFILAIDGDKLWILEQNSSGTAIAAAYSPGSQRDTSAWYHIVVAMDTTLANTADRLKSYINGVQQAMTGTNSITQNYDSYVMSTSYATVIGQTGGSNYFDGYMTEANFVDGQALDPSYFGYFDSITNIWLPKKYIGAYGVNGFYLPFTDNSHATQTLGRNFGVGSNYTAYSETIASWQTLNNVSVTSNTHIAPDGNTTADTVTMTSASAGSYIYHGNSVSVSTPFTASMWFKAGTVNYVTMSEGHTSGAYASFSLTGNGAVTGSGSGATNANITPAGNGWYRCSYTYTTGASQSTWGFRFEPRSTYGGAGSVGDSVIAWGAQLNFGVTIGPYNPSTSSMPSTDWAANNFSITAGVTYDSMVDSPTNVFTTATDIGGVVPGNYCTLNPIDQGTSTATSFNGALTAQGGTANAQIIYGNMGMTTGKWYWESTITAVGGEGSLGISLVSEMSTSAVNYAVGYASTSYGYYASNGNKFSNSTFTAYGASWTTGNVIGIAFDADARTLTFYKDGVSQGVAYTSIPAGTYKASFGNRTAGGTSIQNVNFGQRPFLHTPPAGFKSLNTTNLQALGTAEVGTAGLTPNKWFDITLYGGSGTLRNVENSGFQPDMLWIKDRNAAQWHNITDSVRGAGVELFTNATNAEESNGGVASLNNNGFSLINWDGANKATDNYVAWQWKQSPTSGFNIVPYAGSAAGAQSITHNLGVAPKMMIIKCRTAATTQAWAVYHSSLGATKYAILNTTAEAATGSTYWNNTAPTSSVFTVGTHNDVNIANSAYTYIAYLWAEVPGFSTFGSYTGNGATDGPFVYTGFRPKFVLTKCSSGYASYWTIMDTTRDSFNDTAAQALWPNATDVESAAYNFDILSNGFKIRATTATLNQSGATYIYAAFAESPFGLNNRAR